MNNIESVIRESLQKIETLVLYASKNLIKTDKFYPTKNDIEDKLKTMKGDFDEIDNLMLEKVIPKFRNMHKSDIFMDPQKAVDEIMPLNKVLIQLLMKYGVGGSLPDTKPEIVILACHPHDGRQYLRSIFSKALNAITIRDNYLKSEILDVLTEYIIDKPKLKILLLVQNNKYIPSLKASYVSLNAQYPNRIELGCLPEEQKDHPRYIIIDNSIVFNPDHSLDQFGISTVNIHQLENDTEISKVILNISDEW